MCESMGRLINSLWYKGLTEEQQRIAQAGLCCGCSGCDYCRTWWQKPESTLRPEEEEK